MKEEVGDYQNDSGYAEYPANEIFAHDGLQVWWTFSVMRSPTVAARTRPSERVGRLRDRLGAAGYKPQARQLLFTIEQTSPRRLPRLMCMHTTPIVLCADEDRVDALSALASEA
jgi:hypothetical protein